MKIHMFNTYDKISQFLFLKLFANICSLLADFPLKENL